MLQQFNEFQTVSDYLSGNRQANQLIEKYIQSAFNSWKRKFGFETDDILSDIRYKIFLSLKENKFSYQSKLETYINRIVNHTCIDYVRFNKRFTATEFEELNLTSKELNPEEQLEKRQYAKLAFRVLRQLPKECIMLWRMHLKKELNCREIGDILGKKEGNIRRRLWACRQAAKEIREKLLKKDKLF